MAIAFDAQSSAQTAFGVTVSWSHTCTGSDRLLTVFVGTNGTAPAHTSVTYNSVALTKIADATTGSIRGSLWQLIAPATGENTVAVTVDGSEEDTVMAGAISFTGVHQTVPSGTPNTATGNGTGPTVDIASAVGEIVVDGCFHGGGNTALSSGQTIRWGEEVGGGADVAAGSTADGAASVTMSYTAGASDDWVIGGVSIKPAGAAATSILPKMMSYYYS